MLKLLVMRILMLFLFGLEMIGGWFSPFVQLDLARIISPKSGTVIQGTADINGTVTGIGFLYAEISFQNADARQDTWFLIDQINQVVVDDTLVRWDTNSLADGTYHLRVVAFYEDGHQIESLVEGLRIRNYTAIETLTSDEQTIIDPSQQQTPTRFSPSSTPVRPTPTALPPNDLALSEQNFIKVAVLGGLAGVFGLMIIGLLLLIQKRR